MVISEVGLLKRLIFLNIPPAVLHTCSMQNVVGGSTSAMCVDLLRWE